VPPRRLLFDRWGSRASRCSNNWKWRLIGMKTRSTRMQFARTESR
jgi:hypothetical protein